MKKIGFETVGALLGLGLILVGCGGGGGGRGNGTGGSTGSGVMAVSVNFTPGTAGGPTGISEVITVKTAAGAVLQSQTVNKPTSGNTPQVANFSGLPNQTLTFHAALYSGTNGAGTATGTINTTFAGNGQTVFTTVIGQPVASVAVTPEGVSLVKGGTAQLFAAAEDSSGDLIFESTVPAWKSNAPSVAAVSGAGLVTGNLAGQSTVTASLGAVQGSTTIVVTGITKETWTIMVFMNADNDLDAYSIQNEKQMEQIAQTPTSATRMILQWKLSNTSTSSSQDIQDHPFPPASSATDDTRRYLEVAGGRELVQDLGQGVDMGSATTLQQFITWTVQNYPATHYALVMWDHGNGWSFKTLHAKHGVTRGISYDYDTGHHIDVNQLEGAIAPNHLDIIAFDACQMQMLEIDDQLANDGATGRVADYCVASEDVTPDPGYPYNSAFSQFFSTPNGAASSLAKGIVDAEISYYTAYPGYSSTPVSQSVVDLSKITNVTTALKQVATVMLGYPTIVGPISSKTIRPSLYNYTDDENGYYYYDLGALGKALEAAGTEPIAMKTASTNLVSTVSGAVVYSQTIPGGPTLQQVQSTGLCVDFSPSSAFSAYSADYAELLLAQQSHWGQVLGSSVANP